MAMIPVYKPYWPRRFQRAAIEAIRSGWVSNHGENVTRAQALLAKTVDVPHCILMANGTCATHCLFLALKFKYPQLHKIYVPNNVYVAVWNAALSTYPADALSVLPMSVETWNSDLSTAQLQQLDRNSAVVIVHNLGNVLDVPRIKRDRPDLVLVEDNCEGLFGRYSDGRYTGSSPHVLASSCSFYGNKFITTGEGGAFMTHDADTYAHIKRVYSQGQVDGQKFVHDVHAYNYRMTNVQAGFLLDQLPCVDTIVAKKTKVWQWYRENLTPLVQNGHPILLAQIEPGTVAALWMFAVRIPALEKTTYAACEAHFASHNIDIRPFFYPIDTHAHLKAHHFKVPHRDRSDTLSATIILLPSYPTLRRRDVVRVCDALRSLLSG